MEDTGIRGVRVVGSGGSAPLPAGSNEPSTDDEGPNQAAITEAGGEPGRRLRRFGASSAGWRGWRGWGWRLVVLVVLAVLGLAGTIGFGLAWYGSYARSNNVHAAQAQVEKFIVALTNFDPSTLNADFNKIQSYAVDPFASQANQFFGSGIRKQLEEASSASRGDIQSVYVQSATASRVDFFAVVDETIVNNKIKAPVADELRMVVTMTNTSHGWRVSNVNVLQAPPTSSPTASGSPSGSSTPTTAPATTPKG
ncbi:MAG: hypothetical protein ACYCZM_12945 [Acidimicrobiales bacterium]